MLFVFQRITFYTRTFHDKLFSRLLSNKMIIYVQLKPPILTSKNIQDYICPCYCSLVGTANSACPNLPVVAINIPVSFVCCITN